MRIDNDTLVRALDEHSLYDATLFDSSTRRGLASAPPAPAECIWGAASFRPHLPDTTSQFSRSRWVLFDHAARSLSTAEIRANNRDGDDTNGENDYDMGDLNVDGADLRNTFGYCPTGSQAMTNTFRRAVQLLVLETLPPFQQSSPFRYIAPGPPHRIYGRSITPSPISDQEPANQRRRMQTDDEIGASVACAPSPEPRSQYGQMGRMAAWMEDAMGIWVVFEESQPERAGKQVALVEWWEEHVAKEKDRKGVDLWTDACKAILGTVRCSPVSPSALMTRNRLRSGTTRATPLSPCVPIY